MTRRSRWCRLSGPIAGDRGSATILVLGICMAVVMLAGLAATVSKCLIIHRQVATAADLAALGGAEYAAAGDEVACAWAGQVAQANGATVVGCRIQTLDLVVRTAVAGPAGLGTFHAVSRAGPILRAPIGSDSVATGSGQPGVCAATTKGGTRGPLGRSMVRCDRGRHAGLATHHRQGGPHGAVDGDSHRWRPYGARGRW